MLKVSKVFHWRPATSKSLFCCSVAVIMIRLISDQQPNLIGAYTNNHTPDVFHFKTSFIIFNRIANHTFWCLKSSLSLNQTQSELLQIQIDYCVVLVFRDLAIPAP